MSEWKKLKREFYRKDALLKYHGGIINFSPESINSVENGTFKSYSELPPLLTHDVTCLSL